MLLVSLPQPHKKWRLKRFRRLKRHSRSDRRELFDELSIAQYILRAKPKRSREAVLSWLFNFSTSLAFRSKNILKISQNISLIFGLKSTLKTWQDHSSMLYYFLWVMSRAWTQETHAWQPIENQGESPRSTGYLITWSSNRPQDAFVVVSHIDESKCVLLFMDHTPWTINHSVPPRRDKNCPWCVVHDP